MADIARDAGVGGTVAYAYFPNKEALFLAAVDDDAAAVIVEGVSHILDDLENDDWRGSLVFTLVEAVDRHPLARRLLAGLEPEVTARVMDIPALARAAQGVRRAPPRRAGVRATYAPTSTRSPSPTAS